MTIRAPPTLATLWRSPGSRVSRVPGPAYDIVAGDDASRSLDNHQPGPFTHLVVAQFLTRREADNDRACPVDGLEDGRQAGARGCLNLSHVP
jgi:hypothetical protein